MLAGDWCPFIFKTNHSLHSLFEQKYDKEVWDAVLSILSRPQAQGELICLNLAKFAFRANWRHLSSDTALGTGHLEWIEHTWYRSLIVSCRNSIMIHELARSFSDGPWGDLFTLTVSKTLIFSKTANRLSSNRDRPFPSALIEIEKFHLLIIKYLRLVKWSGACRSLSLITVQLCVFSKPILDLRQCFEGSLKSHVMFGRWALQ